MKYFFAASLSMALLSSCTTGNKHIPITYQNEVFSIQPKYKHLFDSSRLRMRIYSELNPQNAYRKMINLAKTQEEYFISDIEPYTGQNTIPEPCRIDQLKREQNENPSQFYSLINLYASEYFQLGCRTEKPIKAQSLLLYCTSQKKLYSILLLLDSDQWPEEPVAQCI